MEARVTVFIAGSPRASMRYQTLLLFIWEQTVRREGFCIRGSCFNGRFLHMRKHFLGNIFAFSMYGSSVNMREAFNMEGRSCN